MFEAPVTFIESKKQKTSFEDVDGNKVIGYLEKDSPGTSNNINFPDFNTFSYRGVIRYRRTGNIVILSTRYQSMPNSSVSPYFCVGQGSASGHTRGLKGGETGERREKYGFFIFFCLRFFFCLTHYRALRGSRFARGSHASEDWRRDGSSSIIFALTSLFAPLDWLRFNKLKSLS